VARISAEKISAPAGKPLRRNVSSTSAAVLADLVTTWLQKERAKVVSSTSVTHTSVFFSASPGRV
jgi:hypothetical protein